MPNYSSGFDLDAIRRINKTVVNDDGTVKSFKEQLLEYEYGYYNATLPFIVLPTSAPLLQAGARNHPIIMNANVLAKLKQKHDLVPMEIAELPKMMAENNVLMLDSYTYPGEGLCMYLDARGIHDIPLFAALHLNERSGEVSVNRLASVYERANIEFTIARTWEKGLNLYPNKKTGDWLKSLGLQLPDNLASLLTEDYRSVSKDRRVLAHSSISNPQVESKFSEKSSQDRRRLASTAQEVRSVSKKLDKESCNKNLPGKKER